MHFMLRYPQLGYCESHEITAAICVFGYLSFVMVSKLTLVLYGILILAFILYEKRRKGSVNYSGALLIGPVSLVLAYLLVFGGFGLRIPQFLFPLIGP